MRTRVCAELGQRRVVPVGVPGAGTPWSQVGVRRGEGSRDRGPAAVRADQQSGPYRRGAQGDDTIAPATERGGATDAGASAPGVLLQQPVQDGPPGCDRRWDTRLPCRAAQALARDDDLS